MATLERIRSNAALLIGVIAFALAAFIIGDFLKNPKGANASGNVIAEINGTKVTYTDYQSRVNELTEMYKMQSGQAAVDKNTSDQIDRQVWDGIKRDNILKPQFEEIGIAVTVDELEDRTTGNNTDPIVRQIFTNPQTGQFDKSLAVSQLKNILSSDNAQAKESWKYYENMIKDNRKNTKYNNLITKGLMVTPKQASLDVEGLKENKSIEFFSKPYASINDSLVTVSAKDITAYYNAHKELYKQDEVRKIEYISFPIVASAADFKAIQDWIGEAKTELEAMSKPAEIRNYVKVNSDAAWNESFQTEDQIDARYKEFVKDSEVGSVYGSYLAGDTYKIAKLVSREMRPDSVEASHILIQGQDPVAANTLADSLYTLVQSKPSMFAEVATANSADQGSAVDGGELGWFSEGMMVKEFNDACFTAKKGDIVKVTTRFGIHIIKITGVSKDSEKYQLAEVARKVEPSTDTYRSTYAEASKFVGEMGGKPSYAKFTAGVEADKLSKRAATLDKNAKAVNNLSDARSLVKWAYNAEEGSISDILEINDQYIVAALTDVNNDGYKTVSEVSSRIKSELVKDKKAEKIIAEIDEKKAGSETLSSIAQKMSASIKSANGINFQSYQVTGAGYEPALVGAVVYAEGNEISEPVKGNSGVYMFRVVSESAANNVQSASQLSESKTSSYAARVSYQAYDALEKTATITDNRYKFF